MIAVADTSFVLAVGNRDEIKHEACVNAFMAQRRILLPQSVLMEVCYMLTRSGGNRLAGAFLTELPSMKYEVLSLTSEDIALTARILTRYADTRLDVVDATVAAVAERLGIVRIMTLDVRDFSMIRPGHTPYFELIPAHS